MVEEAEEEQEEEVLFEVEAEYDFEKSEEMHYSLVAGQRYKVQRCIIVQ